MAYFAWVGVVLILVLAATDCSALATRSPLPELLPGAIRVPTNDDDPGTKGTMVCTLNKIVDGVAGTLDGDPREAPFSVWLSTRSQRKLIVLWPRGFSIRFEPDLELIDRRNRVIARRGDTLEFNLPWDAAAGTTADPYKPSWINHDCFPIVH